MTKEKKIIDEAGKEYDELEDPDENDWNLILIKKAKQEELNKKKKQVEWLKKELYNEIVEDSNVPLIFYDRIKRTINEAFEDVMKNKGDKK